MWSLESVHHCDGLGNTRDVVLHSRELGGFESRTLLCNVTASGQAKAGVRKHTGALWTQRTLAVAVSPSCLYKHLKPSGDSVPTGSNNTLTGNLTFLPARKIMKIF